MNKLDRMSKKSVKFLFVSQNSPIECEVIRQVQDGICLCRLLDRKEDDEDALFCSTVKGLEKYVGSYVKISVKHSQVEAPSKYTIELKG